MWRNMNKITVLLCLAAIPWVVLGVGHDEVCDELTLICDAGLTCLYQKCSCLTGEGFEWDAARGKCVGRVGAACSSSDDCVSNGGCESLFCSCNADYSRDKSGHCAKDLGASCGPSEPCNDAANLVCKPSDSTCDCAKDGTFLYEDGFCNSLVGAECDPFQDPWGFPTGPTGRKCVQTASCERDPETNAYNCGCPQGSKVKGDKTCAAIKSHGETCNGEDQLCDDEDQKLSCLYQTCSCLTGDGFEWDESRNRCVGRVGSSCETSEDCVDNSGCTDGLFCSCSTGFSRTKSGQCATSFGGSCNVTGGILCNEDAHLHCNEQNLCRCDETANLRHENEFCRVTVGQSCDPYTDYWGFPNGETGNRCVESAVCQKGSTAAHTCGCPDGLEVTPNKLCDVPADAGSGTWSISLGFILVALLGQNCL